jgi:hypothetical protein
MLSSRPKHNLLLAINRFYYLSAPQLTRLVYGSKVLKYVRGQLRELRAEEYVQPVYLPRTTPGGKSLAIYCLAQNGVRYIRRNGVTPATRSSDASREWLFLAHTLEANDLLIGCHELARVDPSVHLVEFQTERELKRFPGQTRIRGRRVTVIPDGWVHLKRQWPNQSSPANHYISWELDRGTIEQHAFRRKIEALVTWIADPAGYEQRFGVDVVNVAIATSHSDKRATLMRQWTEAELERLGKTDYSELFLFSHLEPAEISPTELMLGPIWHQPFSSQPTALLEAP